MIATTEYATAKNRLLVKTWSRSTNHRKKFI
jgi:hypothetical protein